MAVTSTLRAVLAAHLQATWNRTRKELGGLGQVVQALVLLAGLAFGAVPIIGGSLAGGYVLAARLGEVGAAQVLGGILGALTLLGGVTAGLSGGSRVLAWEATRVFPIRLRDLFLAELAAGLGDLLPLVIAAITGCLLAGIALRRPLLLPLLPLLWLGSVAGMLSIQYLVNSLAAQAVRRLRVGLGALAALAWIAMSMLPARAPHQVRAEGFLPEAVLRGLLPALQTALAVAQATPPFQAVAGLRQAALGHWGAALALQLYPLAALALLLLAAAWTLNREADPQTLRAAAAAGPQRLWSFSSPLLGVARLHWQTLITSHLGRFGFLVPLMVVVLIKGPLVHAPSARLWQVPAAFAYLALTGVQFQLNQFGLDGPGVKTLFLLPLESRTLLAGKALGLAAYMAAQTLVLMLLLTLIGGLPLGQVLPALCLSGCLFLIQVSLGHWTSVWLPRPMPRDSLKKNNLAPAAVWLGMASTGFCALSFGGIWLLLGWLAPYLLLPVLALLLAGLALLYRKLFLPAAAGYLDGRREVLVQALGRLG